MFFIIFCIYKVYIKNPCIGIREWHKFAASKKAWGRYNNFILDSFGYNFEIIYPIA